jgi:hypothetical protein
VKIANLLIAQREAPNRTKTPFIWQVFVNKLSPGSTGDSVKRVFEPQAAWLFTA